MGQILGIVDVGRRIVVATLQVAAY
jgi:hypothetical protein